MATSRDSTQNPMFISSLTSAFSVPSTRPINPHFNGKLKMTDESETPQLSSLNSRFLMSSRLMGSPPNLTTPLLRMVGPTPFPVFGREGSTNLGEEGKEGRVYSCNFCRSNFSTSQALGGHQNAHKQERALTKLRHSTEANALNTKYTPYASTANRPLGVRRESMIYKAWGPPPTPAHHQRSRNPSAAAVLRMLEDCPPNDDFVGGPTSFSEPSALGHRLGGVLGYAQYAHNLEGGAPIAGGQPLSFGRIDYLRRVQEKLSNTDANGIDLSLRL